MTAFTAHGLQGFIPLFAQFGTIVQVIVLLLLLLLASVALLGNRAAQIPPLWQVAP